MMFFEPLYILGNQARNVVTCTDSDARRVYCTVTCVSNSSSMYVRTDALTAAMLIGCPVPSWWQEPHRQNAPSSLIRRAARHAVEPVRLAPSAPQTGRSRACVGLAMVVARPTTALRSTPLCPTGWRLRRHAQVWSAYDAIGCTVCFLV